MYLEDLLFPEDELIDLEKLIKNLKEENFKKDNTELLEGENIILEEDLLFSEDELIDLETLIESLKEEKFEKDNTYLLEGKNIIIPTNN